MDVITTNATTNATTKTNARRNVDRATIALIDASRTYAIYVARRDAIANA